jgi:hypothetical protein
MGYVLKEGFFHHRLLQMKHRLKKLTKKSCSPALRWATTKQPQVPLNEAVADSKIILSLITFLGLKPGGRKCIPSPSLKAGVKHISYD